MTGPLSEICIATDRFHEIVLSFVKFETAGGSEILLKKRLCQQCGLWDTYIQEEHGPEPYPPNPYGPGGARRRFP